MRLVIPKARKKAFDRKIKLRYGFCYTGSKNSIAEQIVEKLPKADVFVDLFCGGCAISHCAMLSGKYKNFVISDYNALAPDLFRRAMNGEFRDEKRWISREDFFRLKDTDGYVKWCWSFGASGQSYLYSKEIEPFKKALYFARNFGDFSLFEKMGIDLKDASRTNIKKHKDEIKEKYIKWYLKNVLKSDADFDKLKENLQGKIKDNEEKLRNYLNDALKKSGLTQAEVERRINPDIYPIAEHFFGRFIWKFPSEREYKKMQEFMPLEKSFDEVFAWQKTMMYVDLLLHTNSFTILQISQRLERLQRLESLQSLQRLEGLQSLERLNELEGLRGNEFEVGSWNVEENGMNKGLKSLANNIGKSFVNVGDGGVRNDIVFDSGDYREVWERIGGRLKVEGESAVVYCDPPYKNTTGYEDVKKAQGGFDYDAFYEFVRKTPNCFFSEYNAPDDFVNIFEIEKRVLSCGSLGYDKVAKAKEKLFCSKETAENYFRNKTPKNLFEMYGVAI